MRTLVATFGRFIAAFLTLAMLTSSIAMAAYVCPKVAAAHGAAMAAMAAMGDMDEMDSMDEMATGMPMMSHTGMDEQQPVHCAERHAGDKQALEHSGSSPAPALPAIVSVQLVWPATLPAWQVLATPASPTVFSSHAPPFLRTHRLRI